MEDPEIKENSKYWLRIKKNIKRIHKEGKITKRYKYESFCNNFIPDIKPLTTSIRDKCLCDHDIIHNYKYTHKDRDDWFILGSCCIKKFSTVYKNQRKCKECGDDIRKNDDNICKKCRDNHKQRIKRQEKEIESRKCKGCGYIKNDDKYKYCYKCKYGDKIRNYKKCVECGNDKKENTYRKCYNCNMQDKQEYIYDPIEDNIRVALDSWTD